MTNDMLKIFFDDIGQLKEPDSYCRNNCRSKLEKWLNQIRYTNKSETLNEILKFIQQSNKYNIDLKDRVYLMDKLYEPLFSLIGNIKPNFLNTPLPLTQENLVNLNLCLSVYDEIIVSYTIVLREQLTHNGLALFSYFKETQNALIIQRITRYLSQIILTKYEVYHDIEGVYWQKLYSLLLFSERCSLHYINVYDPMIRSSTSIKNTWLQIILLALSNPYQFNQLQIYYVYKCLSNWANLVELKLKFDFNADKNHGQFIGVCIADNYMPTINKNGNTESNDTVFYINTSQLTLKELNGTSHSFTGFLSQDIKEAIVSKLRTIWSIPVERKFKRKDYRSRVKVVIGLKNVHFVLNEYQQPLWMQNQNLVNTDVSPNEFDYEQMLNSVAAFEKGGQQYEELTYIHTFSSQNISMTGISIIWDNEYPINLRVGNVIALSYDAEEKPESWLVGVVKRIQQFQNEPVRFGVQLLSQVKNAVPISIKVKNNYMRHRAIMLPKFDNLSEPESILIEPLVINLGQEILITYENIEQEDHEAEATIVEKVENTPFFNRYVWHYPR